MSTHRTCCCGCGDRPCTGNEFKYGDTSGSCPICALGRVSARNSQDDGNMRWGQNTWTDLDVFAPNTEVDVWYPHPHPSNLYVGDICLDTRARKTDSFVPPCQPGDPGYPLCDPPLDYPHGRRSAEEKFDDCPPNCQDIVSDYYWGYEYSELNCDIEEWTDGCWQYYPMATLIPYNDPLHGREWIHPSALYGDLLLSNIRIDDEHGNHDNLPLGFDGFPTTMLWEDTLLEFPHVTYYQFTPPWGFLPWSPQVMSDWQENWGGPLEPRGDCTMSCTEENIGCHSLAFVGNLGNHWGEGITYPGRYLSDSLPFCGGGVVTVPPERGLTDEGWLWVREWVQGGGKLVVLGDGFDSPSPAKRCAYKMGYQGEGVQGFNTSSTRRANWSCMQDDIDEVQEEFSELGFSMPGWDVSFLLKDFAEFVAFNPEMEEEGNEEFFHFCWEDKTDCAEEGFTIPVINEHELEVTADGLTIPRGCCQKTIDADFKKDGLPFSVDTSIAAGLIPINKNGGKRLVGSCDSQACTIVYKKNGLGAVIVIYDATIFGANATQVPIGWYETEAEFLDETLTAEELKLRECNNDFWKFLCEEFLGTSQSSSNCGVSFWDEFQKPYNENACVNNAACCLPDGECVDTNVWDCFKQEGMWQGTEDCNMGGLPRSASPDTAGDSEQRFFEGRCNPTCEQLLYPCHGLHKGVCCKAVEHGFECASPGEDIHMHECYCKNTDMYNLHQFFYTEGPFASVNECDDICTTTEEPQPECGEDGDCPEGQCCEEESCGSCPCGGDGDCPEGQCCDEGFCGVCPECGGDGDCPEGQCCEEESCIPCPDECEGDSDCEGEDQCCGDDGTCEDCDDDDVTTPPPSTPPPDDECGEDGDCEGENQCCYDDTCQECTTTPEPECEGDSDCEGENQCCYDSMCEECDCSDNLCCCDGDCNNCVDNSEGDCTYCLGIGGCDICDCILNGEYDPSCYDT